MPPSAHATVLRRHRETAVRTLLPATTERSWVWTSYVEQGDHSAPQLRDIHAEAQRLADEEETRKPAPAPPERVPVTPSSGLVMSPRYEERIGKPPTVDQLKLRVGCKCACHGPWVTMDACGCWNQECCKLAGKMLIRFADKYGDTSRVQLNPAFLEQLPREPSEKK